MAAGRTASLVKLGDSGYAVADPAEDVRGRKVKARDGEEIGTVDDLLIDAHEQKVRFLRVEHGGILGFGATPSFIPVDAVTRVEDDWVEIDQSRQRVSEAPRYDPDLVDEGRYYHDLYGYYGYAPFSAPGYVYPGYPYPRA